MDGEYGQALPAGSELDGYHIESVLGSGGFGITYRAREIEIKRSVAITSTDSGRSVGGRDKSETPMQHPRLNRFQQPGVVSFVVTERCYPEYHGSVLRGRGIVIVESPLRRFSG
jgi:hypothetical protein